MVRSVDSCLNHKEARGMRFKLCMEIAGIGFTDTIVRCEDWSERKAEFEGIGLGKLPILKVDDRIFCQSDAISEWAAKKANLIPNDPDKALSMRMFVGEFIRFFRNTIHEWSILK